MPDADYMCARESFATELDGTPVVVRKGEHVRSDHSLVRGNPEKFVPIDRASRWDTVEQATAAPGEKRSMGRRSTPKETANG